MTVIPGIKAAYNGQDLFFNRSLTLGFLSSNFSPLEGNFKFMAAFIVFKNVRHTEAAESEGIKVSTMHRVLH